MRMKVLEIINSARIAGTERHLLLLLKHIDRTSVDINVVLFQEGPLAEMARDLGFPVQIISGKFISKGISLFNHIRKNGYDVVHTHSGNFANGIAKLYGVPRIIATVHGIGLTDEQLERMGMFAKFVYRFKYRLSDALITVCKFDSDILVHHFGIETSRLFNVYNGIEETNKSCINNDSRKQLDNEFSIPGSALIIGTVARLSPQKGISYLLKAFSQIRAEMPEARLVIIGDGELRNELESETMKLGIEDCTIFTGYRTDADTLLGGFDIFVLPSVWEGLPYSILEAMKNGVPVIASAIFGIPEMVNDENGILVKPKDCAKLAEAMRRLGKDRNLRRNMGQKGRESVKLNFNASGMATEILSVYKNQRLPTH